MFSSLFFTVDKAHAHDLSSVLRGNNIQVYPLTEDTPRKERQRFVRMFKEGSIDGLASCGVLVEGFDAPKAAGGFLCRPTQSGLLYQQMCGRILRPWPAPIGPRQYQRDTLNAIWKHIKQGIINQLIVWPTGTGKTWLSSQLPRVVDYWKKDKKRGRLLFLVHREELVTQTADTFRQHTNLSVGIEKADCYAGGADVVVGSVQTLGPATFNDDGEGGSWTYNDRLLGFNPDQFDCVVVDECHHSVRGKLYQNILRRMRALKGEEDRDPEILTIALTATPNRADNIGMERICDALVYELGLADATKQGFLCPLRAFRCETTVDLSSLKKRLGDFEFEALAKAVNIPERNELVAREYLRIREMVSADFVADEKPYAMLTDFVDNTGRHPLISAAQLYGLREKFNPKGADVLAQAEEIEQIQAESPGLDLSEATDLEDAKRRADAYKTSLRALDLLNPPIPSALRHLSKYTWMSEGQDAYRLGLMDGTMLTVRTDALGIYDISRHVRGVKTRLYVAHSLAEAIKMAEKEIPPSDKRVLAADASWRSEPPTKEQCRRLIVVDRHWNKTFHGNCQKLYEYAVSRYEAKDPSWSRGGVSDLISKIDLARR